MRSALHSAALATQHLFAAEVSSASCCTLPAAALEILKHTENKNTKQQLKSSILQMQPTVQAVSETASSLKERGKQRLNAEQRHAVAAVLEGAGRFAPYALFGPPGRLTSLFDCVCILFVH